MASPSRSSSVANTSSVLESRLSLSLSMISALACSSTYIGANPLPTSMPMFPYGASSAGSGVRGDFEGGGVVVSDGGGVEALGRSSHPHLPIGWLVRQFSAVQSDSEERPFTYLS